MIEKISLMNEMVTCRDYIEIMQIYKSAKKLEYCNILNVQTKTIIVEEIDNLSIKEIVLVTQMFKDDPDFRKFVGFKIREKVIN